MYDVAKNNNIIKHMLYTYYYIGFFVLHPCYVFCSSNRILRKSNKASSRSVDETTGW